MNKQRISQRLRSEFNDLKRTAKSVATDMDYDLESIERFLTGDFEENSYLIFLKDFQKIYPVDISDLLFIESDTEKGILYFSNKKSKESSRILSREDREGNFSPYYDYRDTAKSNLSYFYPEWIAQLRHVKDNDPYNSDVVFNKGHFLHQLNLFVGPVNYYYELNGKKFCIEMNTGDTSYISPFVKHSFASRDKNKLAYIVAVTNGGGVKRSHKEFSNFGEEFLEKNILPVTDREEFIKSIILTAANNELISIEQLELILIEKLSKKLKDFYTYNVNIDDVLFLGDILNIDPGDILLDKFQTKSEVVDKFFNTDSAYHYPNKQNQRYLVSRAAKTKKINNLKGFIIKSLKSESKDTYDFCFSLNVYIINFGQSALNFLWVYKGKEFEKKIEPLDSLYIEPYTEFTFTSESADNSIYLVTTATDVSLETKKELSFFADPIRTIKDSNQWYKGKHDE
tara:strand:+ start:347 stop:1711 length:1365 start_codon:yes stop_codon:yes gene_type:complete